ncbi:hypothetical protein ANO14919_004660 [Xylariales sp. No.14919]|nr:hypothetical protein ANO14919_004660 [Xylariales sp. No.14919]
MHVPSITQVFISGPGPATCIGSESRMKQWKG